MLQICIGGEVQTGSAQSPTSSVGNEYTTSVGGGGVFNSSQNAADEYDFRDFVFPDSAVSSFGKAPNIPDIVESSRYVTSSPAIRVRYHSK